MKGFPKQLGGPPGDTSPPRGSGFPARLRPSPGSRRTISDFRSGPGTKIGSDKNRVQMMRAESRSSVGTMSTTHSVLLRWLVPPPLKERGGDAVHRCTVVTHPSFKKDLKTTAALPTVVG